MLQIRLCSGGAPLYECFFFPDVKAYKLDVLVYIYIYISLYNNGRSQIVAPLLNNGLWVVVKMCN